MNDEYLEKYSRLLEDEALFGDVDRGLAFKSNRGKFFDEDPEDFVTDDEVKKVMEQQGEGLPDVPKKPRKTEEEMVFKRYRVQHEHKYTEKEMKQIREEANGVIVHDYAEKDMYHMSDEERAKADSLAQLRVKISGLHKMYSKVDEYVKAMRIFIEAWETLAKKDNFLHDDKEFFQMVADGRIYNSSIIMPRLRKMEKYNVDLLIKYISNPELDPSELVDPVYSDDDDFYNEDIETDEEKMERLLSPEEALFIEQNTDNPPEMQVKEIKRKYIKGYDQKGYSLRKRKKKLSKKERAIAESTHDILNKIQRNVSNSYADMYTRSWFVTSSLFDKPKEPESPYDRIHFDGSWTSKDDLLLYDLAIQEELMNEHPIGERALTNNDKYIQEFFRTMEDEGLNVIELRRKMNMTSSELSAKENKNQKKENRKREAAIIQRITKLNGDPKFKKLVSKAEKAINEKMEEYT